MHKYIVKTAQQITDSTLLLELKQDDGKRLFTFQPGQYAAISFYMNGKPTAARCFSIASSPTNQEGITFGMRTQGRFTKAAARLKPGDVVKVRGPFGGFVLDTVHSSDIVMLAGGIGITPFMSMIAYATSISSSVKITLLYSCQNQDDVPFFDDLMRYSSLNANLRVIFIIGKGGADKLSGARYIIGRLTPGQMDQIIGFSYTNKTFYTCGPPAYMNAMVDLLQSKKVQDSQINTEAFAQGSHLQTGKMKSWPYNIYALGAAGVVMGSLAIAVSDIVKTMPPSTLLQSINLSPTLTSSNSRQSDLDSLVNGLSDDKTSAPASAASDAAIQANAAAAAASANQQAASSTAPSVSTTPTQVAPVAPIAPVAPVVTQPAPQTCTTTQSGVTTCV